MVPKPKARLGESQEMSADAFAKLLQSDSIDLGALAIELHKQVHHHKNKIDRLEGLVAKQTAILQSLAAEFRQTQNKNDE
jgi:hypothetical protein